MRGRLLRGLRLGGQPDHGLALGQRDQVLAPHDVLDGGEPAAVDRHQLVVRDGGLLQLAQHVAVVAGGIPAFLGDHARQRLHLVAHLQEGDRGTVDQLLRIGLHTDAVQVVGIDFRRQQVALARARQDLLAYPRVVVVELPTEGLEVLLPPLEAALREQVVHALQVALGVAEVLLHLTGPRAGQSLVAEPLRRTLARKLGDRGVTGLAADVLAQPHERSRVARLVDARVEQRLEAAEQHAGHVVVGQHQAPVQRAGVALVGFGRDQDLQVLADARVGGPGQLRLQGVAHLSGIGLEALVEARLQVDDVGVVPVDTEVGGLLGRVLRQQFEQRLGIGVALLDPAGPGGLRGAREARGQQCDDS